MATVEWRRPEFSKGAWFEANPECSVIETKTMMMQNSRTVRRNVDANEQARARAKTIPSKERSSTELRFASFPARL